MHCATLSRHNRQIQIMRKDVANRFVPDSGSCQLKKSSYCISSYLPPQKKCTLILKRFFSLLQLLQNLGKVDRTLDDIFEEHLQNFNRQHQQATRLQKEFNNYIRCIRGNNDE